jgi:hypothetical protein
MREGRRLDSKKRLYACQIWRSANARPEPDFKYFSNRTAAFSFWNAKYATNNQGANLEVCRDRPALWLASRALRSVVTPM